MSNNYKKVITLQFDYSQMSSSVTDINRKMALLDSEFKLAQEQMKSYADETTKTELEIQKLSEKIVLQTQKVNLNKTAYDNAKNSGELTNKQLDSLRKQYIASETQLAKMNNSLLDAKERLSSVSKNTDSYSEKMQVLDSKIKLVDSELKLNYERLKNSDSESKKLSATVEALTEKIELQTQKLILSKDAYDKAKNSSSITEKQLNELKEQYIDNETQLIKMNNSLSEAKKKLDDITEPANKAGKSLKSGSDSAADMAGKLYMLKEALKYVKEALTSYVEFDVSMAKVKTIADTTAVSFKDLKKGVYEIANQTGQSAVTIAEALNECISSNVETKDALNVTLAAAKLAKAGFTDTATAVDVLTTIMNSYGISADYVTMISDKLIDTQDKGKTTVGELGSSFGKVAGLAKTAGISLDEVLAAVSTLTLTNGSASESLTSLKAAISNIIKPTAEARELSKKLHIEFNATSLASKGLSGFLEMVNQKCKGNTETMAKLFGSTEALNAMLLLTGSGAESFAYNLQSLSNASGKTEENLKNLDSTGDRFNKSVENMKTTLIKLGDALSPVIELVSKILNLLSGIPKPVYMIITVLTIMALVISNLAKIKATYAAITTALSAAMAIFGGSATLTTANLLPLLLVLIAIVAVLGLVFSGIKSVSSAFKDSSSAISQITSQAAQAQNSLQTSSNKSNMIKNNASGTRHYNGGRTWVGENGPEIVDLPRGSKIYSNQDSESMGSTVNYYYITIPASDIKEFNDINRIVQGQKQAYRRRVRKNV